MGCQIDGVGKVDTRYDGVANELDAISTAIESVFPQDMILSEEESIQFIRLPHSFEQIPARSFVYSQSEAARPISVRQQNTSCYGPIDTAPGPASRTSASLEPWSIQRASRSVLVADPYNLSTSASTSCRLRALKEIC